MAKNEGVSQRLHFVFLRQVKVKLNGESFYTDEELSKKLKISRSSLQDYRDQGRIPYIKLAGKILYRASDIEKLLEDN
ncbi:helix-turn-helix domain-containing protein [Dysgonomonas termitidis]|uniref:Helix-turn-helix domain-containing protein n=1 Tax=Dysgonomonas termitidis TaxID=1516126 RepID=A0ABV9KY27_9BACT